MRSKLSSITRTNLRSCDTGTKSWRIVSRGVTLNGRPPPMSIVDPCGGRGRIASRPSSSTFQTNSAEADSDGADAGEFLVLRPSR